MSVAEYKMRFIELSLHATILIPTEEESVRRFIYGLHHGICIAMAKEVDSGTTFHQVVEITHCIERIRIKTREIMKSSHRNPPVQGSSVPGSSSGYSGSRGFTVAEVGVDGFSWLPASRVISFLKARRIVEKGCLAYLAFVRDISADTPTVELVPIVREFANVFPANLQSMPPDKDIYFGIDLAPGM
ncbi:uncharacterized protein [Nicotiana tomentosiformis]|uniref:uncharacterized protein n=1 Tax=Nicotiana tomentosiformis TaxID=4098 RepID=UPI00388CAF99